MFGFLRKKDKKNHCYGQIRLLYFNQPVDETVSIEINHEQKTCELLWGTDLYVMPINRLSIFYYHDIFASLLVQGPQSFADAWPVMQNLLQREAEYRGQKNSLKNRDGLKIICQMKEGGRLICLLTSEVFFCMPELYKDLESCMDKRGYTKIEL